MLPSTLILLLLLGLAGASDVGWYHLLTLRLYSRCQHRYEQLAHLFRGVLYLGMLAGATVVELRGMPVWGFLALFALDFGNTVTDTLVERTSRTSLGGLSHGEYIVHVLGSVLSGCAAAAAWFETAGLRGGASVIRWRGLVELDRLEQAGLALGALTLVVWLTELSLTWRHAAAARRQRIRVLPLRPAVAAPASGPRAMPSLPADS